MHKHTHTAGRDHEGSPSLFNHHEKKKKKDVAIHRKAEVFPLRLNLLLFSSSAVFLLDGSLDSAVKASGTIFESRDALVQTCSEGMRFSQKVFVM